MAGKSYFSARLFDFLEELERNNRREWFKANKDRYERNVKGPMLDFISDLGQKLTAISKYYVADSRPVGGSMFRIYRDIRFLRDKSPYKTWIAAHFYHREEGNDVHGPGFYVHLEVKNSMGGGGIWHPQADVLKQVRDRIVADSDEWRAVREAGIKIEGDKLMRPPQGYDAGSPFIEDLKQKDFYSMVNFSEKDVCAAGFMDRYLAACRKITPLMEFLTRAGGLNW